MTLYTVLLELARSKELPEGSSRHGYSFVAPLDAKGHLDAEAWKTAKTGCIVRRFAPDEDAEVGRLVHRGQGWHFDYNPNDIDDDEKLFKLDKHVIKPGEYLSVTEHDGVTRTFRIVTVKSV